jgi:hypothetical protein
MNLKKHGWIPDGKGVMCGICAKKAFEPTNMKDDLKPRKETDLLFGMTSHAGSMPLRGHERGLHYFLADLDNVSLDEVMMRVGKVLYSKEHFGKVYVMKTGKGYHLCEFTHPISLRRYLRLLRAIKADVNFIKWVGKVKYGVLRLSRRSGHWNVPHLVVILNNPDSSMPEDSSRRAAYMLILNLEEDIKDVERVEVFE